MTPGDVVARARELVGQEVLLTVRAQVNRSCPHSGELFVTLTNATAWDIPIVFDDGTPCRDLVDIRPAPLRIEPGALYEVAGVGLCRGQADGGLWVMDAAKAIAAGTVESFTGVKRVKVVDA